MFMIIISHEGDWLCDKRGAIYHAPVWKKYYTRECLFDALVDVSKVSMLSLCGKVITGDDLKQYRFRKGCKLLCSGDCFVLACD